MLLRDRTVDQIVQEFNEITLMRLFEIEVINNLTNEIEYLIFDIDISHDKKELHATHDSLNEEQKNSKYISYVKTEIDPDYSLDQLLELLYEECINAIIESEFYTLGE